MQKIFEYIGLITLMCFSFFITEKTSMIAKSVDDIMVDIKENYLYYETSAKDAKIIDNKIIPGSCGRKVNINKSYNEMKKIGMYDDKLYEYEKVLPSMALSNNYDKLIISGNSEQQYVYIFMELKESNKNLLELYQFNNYNFIVNSQFYNSNEKIIDNLLKNDNSIIINETDYKNYKKILKHYLSKTDNHIYCYNSNGNTEFFETCATNKSSSLAKIDMINGNYLLNVKTNLKRGMFLNINLTEDLIKNLPLIESYITSKGMVNSSIDITLKEC